MLWVRYLTSWANVARTLRVRGRHTECAASQKRKRAGAVFSLELLLVLPILLTVCFGLVELSLLLMGMQRVQAASSAACRVATLPTTDTVAQQQAMSKAAAAALHTAGLVAAYQMKSQVGQYAGDPVVVEVTVPMTAAAPDLLKMIGFSLKGRQMTAQTEMCKQ
jgi:Flp pilus assembly protein TadG